MANWKFIDREQLESGSELALYRDGDAFMIRSGGLELMNSGAHGSEEAFVRLGLEERPGARRILIGGLGLGFTLAEALRVAPTSSQIVVCEISAKVIAWNRGEMAGLNPQNWKDPRALILHEDLLDHLRRAAEVKGTEDQIYDVALLDIDNGPEAMVQPGNDVLYNAEGLHLLCRVLSEEGVVVFWSAFAAPEFEERLQDFFSSVRVETFQLPQNPRIEHVLFVCSGPLQSS